jgi:hypothetical protein
MKKYSVNISFKKSEKCCDFGIEINAADEKLAEEGAKQWAKNSGFSGAVKKITTREIK